MDFHGWDSPILGNQNTWFLDILNDDLGRAWMIHGKPLGMFHET